MSQVAELLQQLSDLSSGGESPYPVGIFPSQRYHPFLPYHREDENLFFSATIAFTLRQLHYKMNDVERKIAESISNGVRNQLPVFQNKDGKPTYNFWQTRPSRHFPNGVFMRRFEHFRIPDDADDTALAHLLLGSGKEEATELLSLFDRHANTTRKSIKNTWPEFKELKAIGTFFGEKMRIEFDAVVMCNALLFLLQHFDEDEQIIDDSLKYVEGIISKDLHKTDPFKAAPNYPSTELIIYHVARLLDAHPTCRLSELKEKLIDDATEELRSAGSPLSKLILQNALLMIAPRSHSERSEESPNLEALLADEKGYFFHAGMMSAFENLMAQGLATLPLFHLRYRCKALNLALLIENQVHRRN